MIVLQDVQALLRECASGCSGVDPVGRLPQACRHCIRAPLAALREEDAFVTTAEVHLAFRLRALISSACYDHTIVLSCRSVIGYQ